MTLSQAQKLAKQLSRGRNTCDGTLRTQYVVYDPAGGETPYQVSDCYELDTFFLGCPLVDVYADGERYL